jgi:CRISPR-associated protein Cas6/Cse3/CasE subtype I-E
MLSEAYVPYLGGEPDNAYQVHRWVCNLVGPRSESQHLWNLLPASNRWQEKGVDWVLHLRTGGDLLPGAMKKFYVGGIGEERFSDGDRLAFRLLASPVRRLGVAASSSSKDLNEKSYVPLFSDAERTKWLTSREDRNGYKLIDIANMSTVKRLVSGRSKDGHERPFTVTGCLYEGVLDVVDAKALKRTLWSGIGPYKTWGFGMMTVMNPTLARSRAEDGA